MHTFLISYDLAHPALNKHALATAIMSLAQAWARPLECTWYIRGKIKECEVRDQLAALLDEEDGLIVQSVSEEAVLSNTQVRWFRQRQPQLDLQGGLTNIVAFPHQPAASQHTQDQAFAKAS
ncbi:MAG: hypothetical protein AB7O43_03390 [Hyphomicrobiaceae bacterium]